MPQIADRSKEDVVGYNEFTQDCTINALMKCMGAGFIGAFLPIPVLKYIKIIPSNIQSQTVLVLVGTLTFSMVVLHRELDRCPPHPSSRKTARD